MQFRSISLVFIYIVLSGECIERVNNAVTLGVPEEHGSFLEASVDTSSTFVLSSAMAAAQVVYQLVMMVKGWKDMYQHFKEFGNDLAVLVENNQCETAFGLYQVAITMARHVQAFTDMLVSSSLIGLTCQNVEQHKSAVWLKMLFEGRTIDFDNMDAAQCVSQFQEHLSNLQVVSADFVSEAGDFISSKCTVPVDREEWRLRESHDVPDKDYFREKRSALVGDLKLAAVGMRSNVLEKRMGYAGHIQQNVDGKMYIQAQDRTTKGKIGEIVKDIQQAKTVISNAKVLEQSVGSSLGILSTAIQLFDIAVTFYARRAYTSKVLDHYLPEVTDMRCRDYTFMMLLSRKLRTAFASGTDMFDAMSKDPSVDPVFFTSEFKSYVKSIYEHLSSGSGAFKVEQFCGSEGSDTIATCMRAVSVAKVLSSMSPEFVKRVISQDGKVSSFEFLSLAGEALRTKASNYEDQVAQQMAGAYCDAFDVPQARFEQEIGGMDKDLNEGTVVKVKKHKAEYGLVKPVCKLEVLAYCVAIVQTRLCYDQSTKFTASQLIGESFARVAKFYPLSSDVFALSAEDLALERKKRIMNRVAEIEETFVTTIPDIENVVLSAAKKRFPADKAESGTYFDGVIRPLMEGCAQAMHDAHKGDSGVISEDINCKGSQAAVSYLSGLQYDMAFGHGTLEYVGAALYLTPTVDHAGSKCGYDWQLHIKQSKNAYELLNALFANPRYDVDVGSNDDAKSRFCSQFVQKTGKELPKQCFSVTSTGSDANFCNVISGQKGKGRNFLHWQIYCAQEISKLQSVSSDSDDIDRNRKIRSLYCASIAKIENNKYLKDCTTSIDVTQNHPENGVFCMLACAKMNHHIVDYKSGSEKCRETCVAYLNTYGTSANYFHEDDNRNVDRKELISRRVNRACAFMFHKEEKKCKENAETASLSDEGFCYQSCKGNFWAKKKLICMHECMAILGWYGYKLDTLTKFKPRENTELRVAEFGYNLHQHNQEKKEDVILQKVDESESDDEDIKLPTKDNDVKKGKHNGDNEKKDDDQNSMM